MTEDMAARPALVNGPTRLVFSLVMACVICLGTGVARATDGSKTAFSDANHLLFMKDHLHNVQPPEMLKYAFTASGGPDDFKDHINLAVRKSDDQGKSVKVDFFSGKRHRYVPEIDDAHGNPIVMVFLQHEVWELAMKTGGSWRYFQRQIKLALQNDANIQKSTASYKGRQVKVTRVSITPYASAQKHRDNLKNAVGARYTFVLSDEVPGGVLSMSSKTPTHDQNKPDVEKVMLADTQPLLAKAPTQKTAKD